MLITLKGFLHSHGKSKGRCKQKRKPPAKLFAPKKIQSLSRNPCILMRCGRE